MKKIIITLLILFLTGCSANYDLKIDGNKVEEKAKIQIEDTDTNFDKVESIIRLLNLKKSEYKIVRDSSDLNISYTKSYSGIEDYVLNSTLYKQVFNEIDITKTKDKTLLSTSANFDNTDNFSINKDNDINIDYLQININSKLPIISQNADTINQDNYTWIYNKKQLSKEINIAFLNKANIFSIKSIVVASLLVVSSIFIGVIIYRRFKERQKF